MPQVAINMTSPRSAGCEPAPRNRRLLSSSPITLAMAALLLTCAPAGLRSFAAGAPEANAPAPADWVDPATGHRVIRLSPDTGGSSLYFHQHTYTPEGDKIIIDTSRRHRRG